MTKRKTATAPTMSSSNSLKKAIIKFERTRLQLPRPIQVLFNQSVPEAATQPPVDEDRLVKKLEKGLGTMSLDSEKREEITSAPAPIQTTRAQARRNLFGVGAVNLTLLKERAERDANTEIQAEEPTVTMSF